MPVAYMDGSNMIRVAGSISELVAGTSAIDTANALHAVEYATNAAGNIVTFPSSYVTGGGVSPQSATYAKEMWDYYASEVEGGQAAITMIGSAGAAAIKWAQGVLFGDPALSGTLAGSGGLLTMSVPTAATLLAPLCGVAIGAEMYNLAPDFWEDVSRTLLPFAYGDTNVIAAVVDANGQVYLPNDAVVALDNLLKEKGIGKGDSGTATDKSTGRVIEFTSGIVSGSVTTGSGTTYKGTAIPDGDTMMVNMSNGLAWMSRSPFTLTYTETDTTTGRSYTNTYTPRRYTLSDGSSVYGLVQPSFINVPAENMSPKGAKENHSFFDRTTADILFNGDIDSPSYFPDGMTAWSGNAVDVSQLTKVPVVSGLDGSTTDYVPVTLPIGDPTVTNNPELQPDPTAPVTPGQLDPYISPVTSPEMWPIFPDEVPVITPEEKLAPQTQDDPMYVPQPNLNPEADPTIIPDVEPAKELPTNRQNPSSGGQSPDPIFPILPFPSWMPAGSSTPVPSGQPGFIQVYHPQPDKFIAFGRWLWVTYTDATIDKIWNNPFDGVISAHELYASPADDGYSTIRCGFLDSGIETQVVRQRYTQINSGSMVIPEYWGNYLDYSPYSQAMLYLPFIGIVPLEVDDIVGHAVNVLYHVDSYTGSCIAQVTVAKGDYTNTLYQFSGNCSVEIPLSGASQAQIKAALMTGNAYQNAANVSATMSTIGGIGSGLSSIINGFGGGAFSGTPAGMAIGAISGFAGAAGSVINGLAGAETQRAYGAAQHTANMLSGKSIVQHSGSFGSSHGAMGIKKPYIIIRRPIQKVVNGYEKLYGYPAHKQVIIGACTGFLRCREVHVLSSLATDAEKARIESLLTSGVYVTEE